MSISNALGNALSGLSAASRRAELVSSNLANATTEGYARREIELAPQMTGGAGSGVRVLGVRRQVDAGILADRRLSDAATGGLSTASQALSRVERLVGAEGDDNSLSAHVVRLEDALISASTDPASEVRLGAVLDRLTDLTTALHDDTATLQDQRLAADASIKSQVDTLNESLAQVEHLNGDILRARNTGQDTNTLLDQRQLVIDKIAEIVPLREMPRQNDSVSLMTANGEMLIDGKARQFEFSPTHTITAETTLAAGGLSGITVDGVPLASDGVGRLDGGTLGAAFELRDQTLPDLQKTLDLVALDIGERLRVADASLTSGGLGLLSDAGAPLDQAAPAGLAGRLRINPVVDPSSGGALFRFREGVGAAAPGPVGNAAQLIAWSSALGAPRPLTTGETAVSASENAGRFTAKVGTLRVQAEDHLGFASARRTALVEAEYSGRVNTDEELQTLMMIEKAYAANARLIQTVDSMLQRLMEI